MRELIEKAQILHEALPYIRRFYGRTFVVKYGGSAMVSEELRDSFARDVVLMKYVGLNPVVVHGGGPQIDRVLEELKIPSERVQGLRVTDDRTMEVVEMVLCGKINKEIVSLIGAQGGRAIGLSGLDDAFIKAEKVPKRETESGEWVDLGRVGAIKEVRPELLKKLIKNDFIPVIASLAIGPDGRSLNLNADTTAGSIATAMRAEKLVLMTDTAGVVDGDAKLIDSLTASEIARLRQEGVIKGGMIPKVECALDALKGGVNKCHIIDGRMRHAILLEIFTDRGIGTEIIHGKD
ncbi:MAG: acetylglutamate kinase [Deltaproteobacteria bacterium]|nr:acetylglutamate kinase [Deltaproteobacteria bacterium]